MNHQELQQKINDLEQRINSLEVGITRDLSNEQKDSIQEIIAERIDDIVWDNFFYTAESDPGSLSGNQTYGQAETNNQLSLNVKNRSRFRAVFNVLDLGSSKMYITTVHVRPVDFFYSIEDGQGEWVGIEIETNGNMYATCYKKGQKSRFLLQEGVADADDYILEIRFFPGERADFYLNKELRGSITNNLPSDSSLEIYDWVFAHVASGTSDLDLQRLEFLQENSV